MTVWGLVDVRGRGSCDPNLPWKHKSDLTVFTEAGAAFFDGRPPYQVRNPRGWSYVYPPVFAMLVAPLHVLPMPDQTTVWFFLCLAMCWGAYRECRRIVALVCRSEAERSAAARCFPWLALITVAAVALPTLNCLQRGQVSILALYLLLLGLRLVLGGRNDWARVGGGILLALPVAVKIVPLLPVATFVFVQLVGYLWNRRQRQPVAAEIGRRLAGSTVGVAFGLALFFFLLPAALIGWNANLRHLNTWSQLVLKNAAKSTATPGFIEDTHSVRNQCLGNALYRLGNFGACLAAGTPDAPLADEKIAPPRLMDSPSVEPCLLFVRIALLLTLLLVAIRLGTQTNTALSQVAGFGLACAALLVVSPVARNHYFVLLAPAVLLVPLWLEATRSHSAAAGRQAKVGRGSILLAVAPGVLILVQYVFLPYVGRIGLLGLGTAAWLMAAMVLMERASQFGPDRGALRSSPAASPAASRKKAA